MQFGLSTARNHNEPPRLDISIWRQHEFVTIKLSGAIDEDNALADQIDKISDSLIVINLRDIKRINSCGVRDWVNWISALEMKGAKIVLTECSAAIVGQLNLVNNFSGNGQVKSIHIPYFCSSCEAEKVLLSEAIELLSPTPLPPAARCNDCDNFMEFDDMPDAYFAFLSDPAKIANPEELPPALTERAPIHTFAVALEKTVSFQSDLSLVSPLDLDTELEKVATPANLKRGTYVPLILLFVSAAILAVLYKLSF